MENCPYCGAEVEIDHDDGYGYQEDEIYEQTCHKCDKTFVYNTMIIYHYELEKCPCKNGSEHDLRPIHGSPREYFVGKERCYYCGEEFLTNPEANRKAMEEYMNRLRSH